MCYANKSGFLTWLVEQLIGFVKLSVTAKCVSIGGLGIMIGRVRAQQSREPTGEEGEELVGPKSALMGTCDVEPP